MRITEKQTKSSASWICVIFWFVYGHEIIPCDHLKNQRVKERSHALFPTITNTHRFGSKDWGDDQKWAKREWVAGKEDIR